MNFINTNVKPFTRKLRLPIVAGIMSFMFAIPTLSNASTHLDILEPGQYIPNLVQNRYSQPFVVQALTERTYFVATGTHNATFYVSDKGVMVIDPLSGGSGKSVIEAIKTVTALPITALVYTHYHLDHLGDAQIFVDHANKENVKLTIIAPQAVADQVARYGNQVPSPTNVVSSQKGYFMFDGLKVLVSSANDTHSIDNSMFLLEGEKVLHYADGIEPEDFIPYFRLVGALDIAPLENNLKQIQEMDWEYLNAGHANVGSRKDIKKHLTLINDIRDSVKQAFSEEAFDKYYTPNADILLSVHKFHDGVANNALAKLKVEYGTHPRFNATMKSHVELMISNLSYYQMPHAE
ncbi:hypothetical protein A9Q77_04490 [Marinomonas sp. 42_23_T18]|nr:hypothetical protein A9Q77_04490 [Marinomonas sp. 42_23_T18]